MPLTLDLMETLDLFFRDEAPVPRLCRQVPRRFNFAASVGVPAPI